MVVGDIVRDTSTGEVVIITMLNPSWFDTVEKQLHTWDFEVMCEGQTYYVDSDDLEVIDATR